MGGNRESCTRVQTEPQQPGSISVSNSISIATQLVWSLQVNPCSALCVPHCKQTMGSQYSLCHTKNLLRSRLGTV